MGGGDGEGGSPQTASADALVCTILVLMRQSNQAARSRGPTSPTHLCRDASSDVLSAVVCAKQSYMRERERECKKRKRRQQQQRTHYFLSLCFSFSPLFLRYQRLQSPPMVSGSQTFPVDLDRCKQTPLSRNVGSHLQAFLALSRVSAEKQAYTHGCHAWDAISLHFQINHTPLELTLFLFCFFLFHSIP